MQYYSKTVEIQHKITFILTVNKSNAIENENLLHYSIALQQLQIDNQIQTSDPLNEYLVLKNQKPTC